jgi:hypothetical protein
MIAAAYSPVGWGNARDRLAETTATRTTDRRSAQHDGPRIKHVALTVESAVAPRRMMLTGVARYIQEHEPWAVYLKPFGVEKSLPDWLRDWQGDGIIAAVHDPAS